MLFNKTDPTIALYLHAIWCKYSQFIFSSCMFVGFAYFVHILKLFVASNRLSREKKWSSDSQTKILMCCKARMQERFYCRILNVSIASATYNLQKHAKELMKPVVGKCKNTLRPKSFGPVLLRLGILELRCMPSLWAWLPGSMTQWR